MTKDNVDLKTIVETYNKFNLTTFEQRVQGIRNSPRGKAILEYFNTFIFPNESSEYNLHTKSYYNNLYTDSGKITEKDFFSRRELKQFDPYVLSSIKQAVERRVIKKEDLGQDEFFVDMVDLAEKEMHSFHEKRRTPAQRQMNSILKKSLASAHNRQFEENILEFIGDDFDKETAGRKLTQYALQIPIEEIEANKPSRMQSREPQMIALFKAYQNGNVSGNAWRKIDETNNTIDVMQYVLSNDPRFKYTGPIAVSQDDVIAVSRVSLASKQLIKNVKNGEQIEGISRWDSSISIMQMLDSVDTLIAMGNIIREKSGQHQLSLSGLVPEDVTGTVVRGVVANRVNGIDSFSELAKKQRTGILSQATVLISHALGILGVNKNNQNIQR